VKASRAVVKILEIINKEIKKLLKLQITNWDKVLSYQDNRLSVVLLGYLISGKSVSKFKIKNKIKK
jgi:hypothetical protein